MNRIWKIIILTIVVGLVFSVVAMGMGASRWVYWTFQGVHIVDTGDEKKITELNLARIENIEISADNSDIEFIQSDQYGVEILIYSGDVQWGVENKKLSISFGDQGGIRFFDLNLSFRYPRNSIKVYLPADALLSTVSVKTSAGNMKLGDFRAGDVWIKNSFGKLSVDSIACNQLEIEMNAGDFTGKNLSVAKEIKYRNDFGSSKFEAVGANDLNVQCSSGGIEMNRVTAANVNVRNDFGNITATDLTSLSANIHARSGGINVSGTFTGQTVIHNNFGNIRFATSLSREDYTYDLSTDFGSVSVDDSRSGSSARGGNESANSLKITNSSGGIQVYFGR